MFTSFSGGVAPILLLSLLAAWFLAILRPVWLRCVLGIIMPIVFSFGWFYLPRLPDLFGPSDRDAWKEWGLVAGIAWSFYAVPVCLVATLAFTLLRIYWQKRNAS
jgi:hypothetical protein